MAANTVAYNSATFGSPLRNGYKFWVSVPMDYPAMIFSLSYLKENLRTIGFSAFPILLLICIGTWFVARMRKSAAFIASRQSIQDGVVFFGLTTVPILLFHLFYFFPGERFFIPLLAGAAVLAGSILPLSTGFGKDTLFRLLLPVVFLLALIARVAAPAPLPLRRLAAERVRIHTPENAIVISAIDPVYLGRLAAYGSSRRIVPLSRNVEYASKLLMRNRVDVPGMASLDWRDPRVLALLRPHAEEAVRFVASERIDELTKEVARGTPVFFESTSVYKSEAKVVAELQAHFNFVQRAPFLYQLQSL